MTNPPSRVTEPEAIELSRTTFACPSWWLSNVWDEQLAYTTRVLTEGRRNITLTMLVPLHKAGQLCGEYRGTYAPIYKDYERLSLKSL